MHVSVSVCVPLAAFPIWISEKSGRWAVINADKHWSHTYTQYKYWMQRNKVGFINKRLLSIVLPLNQFSPSIFILSLPLLCLWAGADLRAQK